jgi:hypothetical protein
MFTTAVHSVRAKKDLLKIYNYLKNPQEILEQDKDNVGFYINVEKSRNSIKNYNIYDELLEKRFLFESKGFSELKGKEEQLTDFFIDNAIDSSTCAYHIYQAFTKNSVSIEEAYKIGLSFQNKMWNFNYYVVLFTHSNKDNIHNHMLVIPLGLEKFNEKNFYKKREQITKEVWNEVKRKGIA